MKGGVLIVCASRADASRISDKLRCLAVMSSEVVPDAVAALASGETVAAIWPVVHTGWRAPDRTVVLPSQEFVQDHPPGTGTYTQCMARSRDCIPTAGDQHATA